MTCCTTSHIQLLGDYRRWLQAANCSPRTVGARLDGARRLLCAADHQPSLITRDHVLAFITSVDAAWSRVTYYQHAATFHAFLTARGDSPGFMQGVPKSRARRGVPRPADPQKVALAILAARRKPAMMLLLATFAGLRVSEIAVVRGEDVGPSIYVHGKGGRTDMLPTHPCITEAAEAFPRSGYWFPNAIGEPITRISVWRHMSEVLRAVGSTDTPHQCRHLYGTALLESGADLRTVQKLLRHASLATTEIYTEVTDVRLRAAILGLPELV